MKERLGYSILLLFVAIMFTGCSSDISNLKGEEEEPVTINVSKWLALGNSITKHAVVSYWWGEWGMAASKKELDYVHVLNKMLEEATGKNVEFEAYNIAQWEFDTSYDKTNFDSYFDGDEDIIVLRIGENVRNVNTYQKEFDALIDYIKSKSPLAKIVVTGNFWTNSTKDQIQYNSAKNKNCIWVALNQFDNSTNWATLNTIIYGEDGLEHYIKEGGEPEPASTVAKHPGDKGMENIATAIFKAIKSNSK